MRSASENHFNRLAASENHFNRLADAERFLIQQKCQSGHLTELLQDVSKTSEVSRTVKMKPQMDQRRARHELGRREDADKSGAMMPRKSQLFGVIKTLCG